MAQTVEYWQNKMLDQIAATPELAVLSTNTSQVAIYRLMTYVVALCINLFEQALDIFNLEIEALVDSAAPSTPSWVKDKVFKFQYSATNPQVVQLINFVPVYAVVDPTLRIITRCSVKTLSNKNVSVKMAKGEPPQKLTVPELNSVKGFLDKISPAGVFYDAVSRDPDRLSFTGQIFYKGEYAAVISSTVITAIRDFLKNIPFDGTIRVSSLVDAIQVVPGVTDVLIVDLGMRPSGTAFGLRTFLVQGQDTLFTKYPTYAGYIIEEDEPSEDFLNRLTFIPE